jgi:hydroxysqualene dehydroxylase
MNKRTPSVIVIGGGWAGLAAAVDLGAAGCDVTVLESARQLGGRARRVDANGEWLDQVLDNGQHILVGAYTETLAILARVGVDPARCLRREPLSVAVPGQLSLRLPRLPAPLHLALGLALAKGPLWREKFAAARFVDTLQRASFRLAADCSVAEWLDAHAQQGTLRKHLWEPLCLAALNTPPAEASAQVFANVLRDTLGSNRTATDLLLPATDLSTLFPLPAAKFVAVRGGVVRCSARVRAVTRQNGGWQVATADETFSAEHVVVACAPQHATALLASPPLSAARARIQTLRYEPIATAYLQYAAPLPQSEPMIALNDGLAQWVFDRGQLGGSRGLYAHVLSARGAWQELSNDDLVAALHRAHTRALSASAAPPIHSQVICEQRATFRCTPDLARPATESGAPNLWLAGDYVASDYPGTLEAAVRSGRQAAARILAVPQVEKRDLAPGRQAPLVHA